MPIVAIIQEMLRAEQRFMPKEEYQEVQAQLVRRRAKKSPRWNLVLGPYSSNIEGLASSTSLDQTRSSINVRKEGFDTAEREAVVSLRYC